MKYYIKGPSVGKETDRHKPLGYSVYNTKTEIIKQIDRAICFLQRKKKEITKTQI